MERKKYAIELVQSLVKGDKAVAETIIERLQDEGLLHLGYGKAEVDQIVGEFKERFNTSRITQQDRRAAHRLANTHTAQAVVQIIRMLADSSGEQYAPSVNNVAQLEEKWVNVINYLRRKTQETEVISL